MPIRRRLSIAAASVLMALSAVAIVAPSARADVPATAPAATDVYRSLAPTRLLDTRTEGQQAVGPRASVSLTIAGAHGVPADATAVVLHLGVDRPTDVGYLTAYPHGSAVPTASNVNFKPHQTVGNLAVVELGADGAVDFFNGSAGTTEAIIDLAGYYAPAPSSDAATTQGAFGPVAPHRLLDTRKESGPVAGHSAIQLDVTGEGVPDDASAVVLDLAVTDAKQVGYATAYPAGDPLPLASSVNFAAGATVPNLVVVPVGANGDVTLYNGSASAVQFVVDISGYYLAGDPVAAGALGALAPVRLLDTRDGAGAPKAAVAAHGSVTLDVAGRGGVPLAGVSAVVLDLTAVTPTSSGFVTAHADGTSLPVVSSLNFAPGQTVANLVIAPVGADGKVVLYNGSPAGTVQLVADVAGYVLASALPPPAASTSHYVRGLDGLAAAGQADAQADRQAASTSASRLHLLHIGAQTTKGLPSAGVLLSATATRLTYAQLVSGLTDYLDGYRSAAGPGATVAIATNSDGDFAGYTAADKGADWAHEVIEPLRAAAPAGVTVLGADDIESGFAATSAQALQWEQAYLGATPSSLLFTGSADGCPSAYGVTGSGCAAGWTQTQYYQLAGGSNPSRIQALPQIYVTDQAAQWANIDATGGRGIVFVGSLTEHATACGALCDATATQGWAALCHALSTIAGTQIPAVATDLDEVS